MLTPSASLLTNKVAVVTGAGGGIGKGIARGFAAHGAKVVVNDIDAGRANETADEIKHSGGTAIAVVADVRLASPVAELAEATFRSFGQVDVLVNNVGHYLHAARDFAESAEEEWDELYAINMKTAFLCTRAFLPAMIRRGQGGSIINLTTVEAFRAIPRRAVYSATKEALTGFTRSLAMEVAEHKIRVNAIAPDKTWGLQVQANYERLQREHPEMIPVWIPVGRFGQPDDMAGIAVFLASDLSQFVTGSTIHADGGTLAAGGWYKNAQGTWVNTPARP